MYMAESGTVIVEEFKRMVWVRSVLRPATVVGRRDTLKFWMRLLLEKMADVGMEPKRRITYPRLKMS